MTKTFCDICGKESVKDIGNHFKLEKPLKKMGNTKISVRVHFGFMYHPTGFGGPPDLCKECAESLLRAMYLNRCPSRH